MSSAEKLLMGAVLPSLATQAHLSGVHSLAPYSLVLQVLSLPCYMPGEDKGGADGS